MTTSAAPPAASAPPAATPAPAAPPRAVDPQRDAADLAFYFMLHRAMRESAAALETAVDELSSGDRRRVEAIARWYRGFDMELHHHHQVEDDIFWPALSERVPVCDDLLARLETDHVVLGERLAAVSVALGRLTDRHETWTTVHAAAREATAALREILDDHLGLEDAEVLPLFARHFTAAEYEPLEVAARSTMSPRQVPFTVPWILAATTDEERVTVWAFAPPALKIAWHLTHRRYARLVTRAFGHGPVREVA